MVSPWTPAGDLFIPDNFHNVVREVNAVTGIITTIAGNGTAASSGDGGPASSAAINGPFGVALDAAGDLFVTENNGNRIREVANGKFVVVSAAGGGSTMIADSGQGVASALIAPASAQPMADGSVAGSTGTQQETSLPSVTNAALIADLVSSPNVMDSLTAAKTGTDSSPVDRIAAFLGNLAPSKLTATVDALMCQAGGGKSGDDWPQRVAPGTLYKPGAAARSRPSLLDNGLVESVAIGRLSDQAAELSFGNFEFGKSRTRL